MADWRRAFGSPAKRSAASCPARPFVFALLRREQVPVSTALRYRERLSMGDRAGAFQAPAAYLMSANASVMGWLMSTPLKAPRQIMKSVADRFFPKPGSGPSLENLDNWHWNITGRASGPAGGASRSCRRGSTRS